MNGPKRKSSSSGQGPEESILLLQDASSTAASSTRRPSWLRRVSCCRFPSMPSCSCCWWCEQSREGSSLVWDRFVIVVLLTAFVVVSVYYQMEMRLVQSQLASDHATIDKLSNVLGLQESVIERFNSSVTNTDVMSRLSALESNLSETTWHVQHQLDQVTADISHQLKKTVDELSQTVSDAEAEIGLQVDKVKADVDQYVIATQAQFSMENSFMVYQLAGTFTLLSCLISMWHMTAHLRKFNQPDVQRRILAILWMSPIYAVTSWFSLVFPAAEGYLAIVKDGYEAYIIYQFLAFLIAVLGKGDRSAVVTLLSRHADHLTPPFRLFGCFELCGFCVPDPYENNRALADAILLQCQAFALQFVFFRPVTTTGMVLCKQFNYYGAGDGPTDYRSPQFYLTIVQNISIFVAFAGLLKFYHAVDSELAWMRPFAKFLCIKGVVFMTFWQGLAISILAETTDVGGKDAEQWARSAQNFLICLEMLLFSIAHFHCFPTDEWEDGYRVKHSHGFGDTVALGDFFEDLKLILRSSSGPKKKKKKKHEEEQPSTIPEGSEDEDTEGLSPATSTEEYDAERAVAEALEESLGIAGDDPDIIEAKKRLLESKVLSPEFFDVGTNFSYNSDDYYDSDDNDYEHILGIGERSGSGQDDAKGKDEGKKEATETTPLRPSIFTTVASIAEKEEAALQQQQSTSSRGSSEQPSLNGGSKEEGGQPRKEDHT